MSGRGDRRDQAANRNAQPMEGARGERSANGGGRSQTMNGGGGRGMDAGAQSQGANAGGGSRGAGRGGRTQAGDTGAAAGGGQQARNAGGQGQAQGAAAGGDAEGKAASNQAATAEAGGNAQTANAGDKAPTTAADSAAQGDGAGAQPQGQGQSPAQGRGAGSGQPPEGDQAARSGQEPDQASGETAGGAAAAGPDANGAAQGSGAEPEAAGDTGASAPAAQAGSESAGQAKTAQNIRQANPLDEGAPQQAAGSPADQGEGTGDAAAEAGEADRAPAQSGKQALRDASIDDQRDARSTARQEAKANGDAFDGKAFNQPYRNNLSDYGAGIDAVNAEGVDTADKANEAVGDLETIEGRDALATEDGQALDGFAYPGADGDEGGIALNNRLNGDANAVQSAATEELGERFYQETFGSTSEGDFGAEVAKRVDGDLQPGDAEALGSAASDDTVSVDGLGTGEADLGEDKRLQARIESKYSGSNNSPSASSAALSGASKLLAYGGEQIQKKIFGTEDVGYGTNETIETAKLISKAFNFFGIGAGSAGKLSSNYYFEEKGGLYPNYKQAWEASVQFTGGIIQGYKQKASSPFQARAANWRANGGGFRPAVEKEGNQFRAKAEYRKSDVELLGSAPGAVSNNNLGFGSDIRIKTNVVQVGSIETLDIGLYAWRYRNDDPTRYVGVMAQELLARPDLAHAVVTMTEGPFAGFHGVNYAALGLSMTTETAWRARGHAALRVTQAA